MQHYLIIFAFLALGLFSCGTDPIQTPPPPPNTDYVPLTKGSWWVYKTNQHPRLDTIYVLDQDTVFGGQTFIRLSKSLPSLLFYPSIQSLFRKDSDDYAGIHYSEGTGPLEEYYALRFQEASWKIDNYFSQADPINPINNTVRVGGNKGMVGTLTVGAKTFDSVYHCTAGQYGTHPYYGYNEDCYFAQGIGLIYVELKGTGSNGIETHELVDFHIE